MCSMLHFEEKRNGSESTNLKHFEVAAVSSRFTADNVPSKEYLSLSSCEQIMSF